MCVCVSSSCLCFVSRDAILCIIKALVGLAFFLLIIFNVLSASVTSLGKL